MEGLLAPPDNAPIPPDQLGVLGQATNANRRRCGKEPHTCCTAQNAAGCGARLYVPASGWRRRQRPKKPSAGASARQGARDEQQTVDDTTNIHCLQVPHRSVSE